MFYIIIYISVIIVVFIKYFEINKLMLIKRKIKDFLFGILIFIDNF